MMLLTINAHDMSHEKATNETIYGNKWDINQPNAPQKLYQSKDRYVLCLLKIAWVRALSLCIMLI